MSNATPVDNRSAWSKVALPPSGPLTKDHVVVKAARVPGRPSSVTSAASMRPAPSGKTTAPGSPGLILGASLFSGTTRRFEVSSAPPAVVIRTRPSTASAGTTNRMLLSLTTVKSGAVWAPTSTRVVPPRWLPKTVTVAPRTAAEGVKEAMSGGGGGGP